VVHAVHAWLFVFLPCCDRVKSGTGAGGAQVHHDAILYDLTQKATVVQAEALGAALRQRRGEAATAVTGRVVLDAEQAEEIERRMHAVTAAVRITAAPLHCRKLSSDVSGLQSIARFHLTS
jgi:hypothetical protein